MSNFTGGDALREWLITQNFKVKENHSLGRMNLCNWYAYRRTVLQARECECNDDRPVQLVVRPYQFEAAWPGGTHTGSAEIDVVGEVGGMWFQLKAYSLRHDELCERLGDIEGRLIAAWNALQPVEKP